MTGQRGTPHPQHRQQDAATSQHTRQAKGFPPSANTANPSRMQGMNKQNFRQGSGNAANPPQNNQNSAGQGRSNSYYRQVPRPPFHTNNTPNTPINRSPAPPQRPAYLPPISPTKAPSGTRKQDNGKPGLFSKLQKKFMEYSVTQRIVLLVCALVFLVSAITLSNYVLQATKQQQALKEAEALYTAANQNESENLQTDAPLATEVAAAVPSATPEPTAVLALAVQDPDTTPVPTEPPLRSFNRVYPDNQLGRIREKFHSLLDINEDIVGWIKIGDFLSQPVVKRDNEFYLTHNYKMEENPAGSIFLDAEADIRTVPENLVFHGHNMRNGSMFGKLIRYKSDTGTKFYLENPIVSFDSLYQDAQYVIFSVFEIETDYDSPNYFPFIAFQKFRSDQDARNFISDVKGRSVIKVPIEVDEKDSLITLATCTLNSETTRLLVIGRKIRPGESMTDINNALYKAVKIR